MAIDLHALRLGMEMINMDMQAYFAGSLDGTSTAEFSPGRLTPACAEYFGLLLGLGSSTCPACPTADLARRPASADAIWSQDAWAKDLCPFELEAQMIRRCIHSMKWLSH